MKIYTYFVFKIWVEEKKSFEIMKIKTSNEVAEYPGVYVQTDNKEFYTNWSEDEKYTNFLPKESIGKVVSHICGLDVVYATYLSEDNEQKAFNIIADKCKKDIEEIKQKLEKLTEIYNAIIKN